MAYGPHSASPQHTILLGGLMRAFSSALLPLFLFVVSLQAGPVRETTTVEVVEVPVYVSRNGKGVTDLRRENFALFVNGKRQEIEYFDVVDFAALANVPAAEAQPDLRQRRLYYLLFDLTSDLFAITRARLAVDRYVAQAGSADLFAVGTLGAGRGFETLVPFTRDRHAVRQAVRAMENRSRDPLRMAVVLEERVPDFGSSQNPQEDLGQIQDSIKDLTMEPLRRQAHGMFAALDDVARQLAPLEGHKHVVLFSTGFDGELVHGVKRPASSLGDWQQGPRSGRDMILPSMQLGGGTVLGADKLPRANGRLIRALEAMNARYASASVFLHAIDTAGVRATRNVADNESLHMLARSGEVVANRNDLTAAIHDLTELQRVVYVLGFQARPGGRNQNRITVRLRDVPRGLSVSYRRSYSNKALPASTDELRLADVVSNDIPQNGLSVEASVEVVAGRARVTASVPGPELLAFGEHVNVEALLYVFSGTRAVAYKGKNVAIETARAHVLRDRPLELRETFDLPPGSYSAKVLLRIAGAGQLGFARRDFVVGEEK